MTLTAPTYITGVSEDFCTKNVLLSCEGFSLQSSLLPSIVNAGMVMCTLHACMLLCIHAATLLHGCASCMRSGWHVLSALVLSLGMSMAWGCKALGASVAADGLEGQVV